MPLKIFTTPDAAANAVMREKEIQVSGLSRAINLKPEICRRIVQRRLRFSQITV